MKLDPRGREYVSFTQVSGPVDVAIELSLDGGATYSPTARVGDDVRVLIAGPDATDNPEGTVVANYGTNRCLFRVIDEPEILIRSDPGRAHVIEVWRQST